MTEELRTEIYLVDQCVYWEYEAVLEKEEKRLFEFFKHCKKKNELMHCGDYLINPELIQFIKVRRKGEE